MKTLFVDVFLLMFTLTHLDYVSTHYPPQLLANETSREIIIKPRETILLECPVRFNRNNMYEWYKEKASILSFRDQRVKVTTNGGLKIKDIIFDDTGEYKCRAINGFGSVEYNITLLVIGADKDYFDNDYGYSQEDSSIEESQLSLTYKPRILYVSERDIPLYKKIGDTFKLQCVATGFPTPEIIWYKNGHQVTRVRGGRWSLSFTNALLTDSGNYTCMVQNKLGKDIHSFILIVDQYGKNLQGRPILTGGNLTVVEEGQKAIMECAVQSIPLLHIEWLRKVDEKDTRSDSKQSPLRMEGEYFNVLTKEHEIESKREGNLNYHKLIIENAQLDDAGKYVCLGANTHGYEYRFAYLDVVRKNDHSFQSSFKFPIVVTVIAVAIFVLVSIFVFLLYCRPGRHKLSNVISADASVDTKEEFIPMHQNAGPSTIQKKHLHPNNCIDVNPLVIYNMPLGTGRTSFSKTNHKQGRKKYPHPTSYTLVPTLNSFPAVI